MSENGYEDYVKAWGFLTRFQQTAFSTVPKPWFFYLCFYINLVNVGCFYVTTLQILSYFFEFLSFSFLKLFSNGYKKA